MKIEIYMANKFYGDGNIMRRRAILIHNYVLAVLDVLLLCAS